MFTISISQLIKQFFSENVTSSSLETIYSDMTCWTNSLCYWMVPVGIFFGFIFLGCVCGIYSAFLPGKDDDDEEDDLKEDDLKEDETIK